jgi:uncharacterized YccA/Bax inhibitor family protein
MLRTSNPALSDRYLEHPEAGPGTMTVQGAVNKSLLLLGFAITAAVFSWQLALPGFDISLSQGAPGALQAAAQDGLSYSEAMRLQQDGVVGDDLRQAIRPSGLMLPLLIGGAIAGLVLALITCFSPRLAPVTGSLYAIAEGVFLGAISAYYEFSFGGGIVIQAALITFGIFLAMLIAYKLRLIQATAKFRAAVICATFGIMLVYLISFVGSFFGFYMPYLHATSYGGSSGIGIGISVFIIVIAAANLILDFDFIERGAAAGAPRYMEWYGAFGLLVTLVWLYLEVLRLLARLRQR